jgi:glycerol-3-phosphate dehydrogenase
MTTPATKKTTVLVCGGGNAAHVLAAVLGSKPEQFEVRVLTMYADEAERWSNKLAEHDGKMSAYLKESDKWFEGTPSMITKDPAEAVPGADWVILALPSTLHGIYIDVLAEHCTDAPVYIGALSPQ